MSEYKTGDVILVNFPYEDDLLQSKLRPAVVLTMSDDKLRVAALKVTTKVVRNESDCAINNWESAGLLKPSVIRTAKGASITASAIVRQLGTLSNKDLLEMLKTYKNAKGE